MTTKVDLCCGNLPGPASNAPYRAGLLVLSWTHGRTMSITRRGAGSRPDACVSAADFRVAEGRWQVASMGRAATQPAVTRSTKTRTRGMCAACGPAFPSRQYSLSV